MAIPYSLDSLGERLSESCDKPWPIPECVAMNESIRNQRARRRPMSAVALIVVIGALVISVPSAWAGWRDDLQKEIRAAQRCDVQRLSNVVERSKPVPVIAAVVDCKDGRRFAVARVGIGSPFIFDRCDAPGTRTCPSG